MKLRVIVVGGALLAAACSAPQPVEEEAQPTMALDPTLLMPVPMNQVSVSELIKAFDANEVAAMRDYGSSPLLVTGKVRGVELDMSDDPVVLFESGRQRPVQALFDKGRGQATADLTKGETASVICNELREVLGNPILDDCWVDVAPAV